MLAQKNTASTFPILTLITFVLKCAYRFSLCARMCVSCYPKRRLSEGHVEFSSILSFLLQEHIHFQQHACRLVTGCQAGTLACAGGGLRGRLQDRVWGHAQLAGAPLRGARLPKGRARPRRRRWAGGLPGARLASAYMRLDPLQAL